MHNIELYKNCKQSNMSGKYSGQRGKYSGQNGKYSVHQCNNNNNNNNNNDNDNTVLATQVSLLDTQVSLFRFLNLDFFTVTFIFGHNFFSTIVQLKFQLSKKRYHFGKKKI